MESVLKRTTLISILFNLLKVINLGICPEVTCPRKFMKEFTAKISNRSDWNNDILSKLNRNGFKCHTDGSKMAEETRINIHRLRIKYFENLTKIQVFSMRKCTHAIEWCLQYNNIDRYYREQEIKIVLVTQAAIKSPGSYVISTKIIKNI